MRNIGQLVEKYNLYFFYKIFCYSGLEGIWYRALYRKNMKDDILFYSNLANEKRIATIVDKLSDEESKITYMKAIKFKQRRKGIDRPHFTYPAYFIPEIGECLEREVFIDGGGYIGDTYEDFCKWSKGIFGKYVFFEPSIRNCDLFRSQISDERIIIENKGLWKEKRYLYFSGGISQGERVEENVDEGFTEQVEVVSIDQIDECKEATFIKMDIEGAELEALRGAIDTIERNRPRLAICIYHSNEDMLCIPEWCFEHCKDYLFYIRHHHYLPCDTVFYAVPVEKSMLSYKMEK